MDRTRSSVCVALNLAVCAASLVVSLMVPWASLGVHAKPIEGVDISMEGTDVGIYRCYDHNCSLKGQPKMFYWAGVMACIFLALANVLAVVAVMAESSRARELPANARNPIEMHFLSFLALWLAPVMYWVLTYRHLNNGHFKIGLYLAFGAAGVSLILLAFEFLMGRQETAGYAPIGGNNKRGMTGV